MEKTAGKNMYSVKKQKQNSLYKSNMNGEHFIATSPVEASRHKAFKLTGTTISCVSFTPGVPACQPSISSPSFLLHWRIKNHHPPKDAQVPLVIQNKIDHEQDNDNGKKNNFGKRHQPGKKQEPPLGRIF